jgi:hypothetical protein
MRSTSNRTADLATRLLHQLSFVSSQSPLDSTSFAFLNLLLTQVVEKGGIGSTSPHSEESQEQLTLVVNIIAACCGECELLILVSNSPSLTISRRRRVPAT